MKLYATTTSERASKGQGGQKFIRIALTIDGVQRLSAGLIEVSCEENKGKLTAGHDYVVKYFPPNLPSEGYKVLFEKSIPKGEKKKGEHCNGTCADRTCTNCS